MENYCNNEAEMTTTSEDPATQLACSFEGVTLDNHYTLEHIIHKGMDVLYAAHSETRKLVVKVIRSIKPDKSLQALFEREIRNMMRMCGETNTDHLDYGQTPSQGDQPGLFYLVMGYIEGERASDYVAREGVLTPDEACEIIKQVADALIEAHKFNILHRDVKADNVLIRKENGHFKATLIDYEIALTGERAVDRTERTLNDPSHLAPELARGNYSRFSKAADIFGLGILFYELVTGKPPFNSTLSVLRDPPPALPGEVTDFRLRLEDILKRWLAKDPAQRPSIEDASDEIYRAIVMQGGRQALQRLEEIPEPLPLPDVIPPAQEVPPMPKGVSTTHLAIAGVCVFVLMIVLISILCR